MRSVCPCCAGDRFEGLIRFDGLPPSGLFRSPSDDSAQGLTLEFELCVDCGLVRQRSAPPTKDYARIDRAAASPLPAHVYELIAELSDRGVDRSDFVLEVGSNDGAFLQAMRSAGYRNLVGVEPSLALAERSRDRGITVVNDYFGGDCATGICRQFGSPKAIICRHTIEHVPEPFSFVTALRLCLPEDGGVLLIELPDGSAVPELLNVYELWDEHLFYFSAENAKLLLCRVGFSVTEVRTYPYLDTRSIVLWARPGSRNGDMTAAQSVQFQPSIDRWRRVPGAWRELAGILRRRLEVAPTPRYAVGASHSQTNFFGFAGLEAMVDFMIDDDPHKAGKHPPMGGGTPTIITTAEFESRADCGSVVLTGFGYPGWTRRIRAHADAVGMQVIDPGELKKAWT